MTFIKESYHTNMTMKDAEKLALQVLKNVMEEKNINENVEVTVVRTDTKKVEIRDRAYIDEIIKTLS